MGRPGGNDADNVQCPSLETKHAGRVPLDDGSYMQTQVVSEVLWKGNLYGIAGRHLWQPSLHNGDMLRCLAGVIAVKDKRPPHPRVPARGTPTISACIYDNVTALLHLAG